MMRGTPGMRLVLFILSPVFLVLCVLAIRSEGERPWMGYQKEFKQLYAARARAKADEAASAGDAQQSARWRRIATDIVRSEPRIEQVYIEEVNVADRCVTCHSGIDNALFADAPQPFRTHPGMALKHHDVTRFGCTLCHDGQGAALTVADAHGRDASAAAAGGAAALSPPGSHNGLRPLIAAEYLEATCLRCHEQSRGLEKADVVNRGADLFIAKGCYGCHGTRNDDSLPKYSPPLLDIASKLKDPQRWLLAWVKDPTALNPGTAMPAFQPSEENVAKIAAFFASLPTAGPGEPVALGDATPEEGERLFIERGCRNCHAVATDDRSVSPRVPHLAGIGSKSRPEWLDRWIADPKSYYPDAAMPKIELRDRERHAIVAYLLTLTRAEALPPAPDLGGYDPAEGKKLVRQYECFGCHAIPGFERVRPSVPNLGEFAKKPIEDLDFGLTTDVPRTKWDWLKRKLREPRAYESEKIRLLMPTVALTPDEAQAVITYVLGFETPDVPPRYTVRATAAQRSRNDLAWLTTRLNCNACHQLNEQEPRLARLPNRTEAIPPALDGVATRFPGQTVYQMVLDPKRARPWAGMRMPTFGLSEGQARAIVDGFAAVSGVTNPYAQVATLSVVGPPLTSLRNKLVDPDWLVAWVLKPSRLRPWAAMPDADMPLADALAVVRYLYQEPAAQPPPPAAWQGGNPETGEKLFVTRGCRGCHAIERGKPSIVTRVPNLAGVGRKAKGDWLFSWVKDPRAYSPRTAMPQLKLKDEEIRDLVAFLLTRKDGADVVAAAPKFDPGRDPAAGRDAIERNGCMRCHEVRGFPAPALAVALVAEVPAGSTAIALGNGRVLLENYNCRACHKLEGRGGEIGSYLERKSLVPPILEGEGARVQTSWLVDFLQEPKNLRPWMQLRMPLFKFPEGEARALAAYLAALSSLTPVDEPLPAPVPELTARGLKIFVRLKCGQCHPTNPDQALPPDVEPEDLSLNLTLAKTRLRPSWIPKFLARPKTIAGTQTRMPAAFYNTDGIPLMDDPDQSIAAVTAYMLEMTELPPAEKPAERKPEQPARDWSNYQY